MRALYAHDHLAFHERAARSALLGLLRAPALGRAFLIESGGAAVGYVVLTLGWSLEYQGRDAFIDELYIDPACRGRGMGRRAVANVEQACRRLGVKALHLEVERSNTAAQGFCRSAGFADHDRYLFTKWITRRRR